MTDKKTDIDDELAGIIGAELASKLGSSKSKPSGQTPASQGKSSIAPAPPGPDAGSSPSKWGPIPVPDVPVVKPASPQLNENEATDPAQEEASEALPPITTEELLSGLESPVSDAEQSSPAAPDALGANMGASVDDPEFPTAKVTLPQDDAPPADVPDLAGTGVEMPLDDQAAPNAADVDLSFDAPSAASSALGDDELPAQEMHPPTEQTSADLPPAESAGVAQTSFSEQQSFADEPEDAWDPEPASTPAAFPKAELSQAGRALGLFMRKGPLLQRLLAWGACVSMIAVVGLLLLSINRATPVAFVAQEAYLSMGWPAEKGTPRALVDRGTEVEILQTRPTVALVRAPGGLTGYVPPSALASAPPVVSPNEGFVGCTLREGETDGEQCKKRADFEKAQCSQQCGDDACRKRCSLRYDECITQCAPPQPEPEPSAQEELEPEVSAEEEEAQVQPTAKDKRKAKRKLKRRQRKQR